MINILWPFFLSSISLNLCHLALVTCQSADYVKGVIDLHLAYFCNFKCYWFWQRTLLWALKKTIMMKIEPGTCILMFVCAMNFWAARNSQKLRFCLFRPNLCEGLFLPYCVCKCSFREISMIKIVILDQNKPAWQI